jgi:ABC-type phosphate/phosphonate transport system substrate-binding protein
MAAAMGHATATAALIAAGADVSTTCNKGYGAQWEGPVLREAVRVIRFDRGLLLSCW